MEQLAALDAFFYGRDKAWEICEALRVRLLERWPDTQLRVMKTCISFGDPKPYAYVSLPPKKSMHGILLSVSLRESVVHPRFYRVVPVSAHRHTVHIYIESKEQIDEELLEWIERAHR